MQQSRDTRNDSRREPPTIDITPDGYQVHRSGAGGRQAPGQGRPQSSPQSSPQGRSLFGALVSLAVVGFVLLGAFALGVLTFLIAIPVAVGAIVAALIAGFFLRRRMRGGPGGTPGGAPGGGTAWQRPGR